MKKNNLGSTWHDQNDTLNGLKFYVFVTYNFFKFVLHFEDKSYWN